MEYTPPPQREAIRARGEPHRPPDDPRRRPSLTPLQPCRRSALGASLPAILAFRGPDQTIATEYGPTWPHNNQPRTRPGCRLPRVMGTHGYTPVPTVEVSVQRSRIAILRSERLDYNLNKEHTVARTDAMAPSRRVLVCVAVCMAAAATGVECFSPVAGGSCMRLREDADARTTRLLAAKA